MSEFVRPSVVKFRFRQDFLGKLILQRLIGVDGPAELWKDADVSDLEDFYKKVK